MIPSTNPHPPATDQDGSTSEESDVPSKRWDELDDPPKNALSDWSGSNGLYRRMFGSKRKLGIFLDYDGTLTPIVNNPEEAIITDRMRKIVHQLSLQPNNDLAIITGRSLPKIRQFMRLDSLCLSGSHGAEVFCPPSSQHPQGLSMSLADKYLKELRELSESIRARLDADFPGTQIEDNKFCHSIHYRNAKFRQLPPKRRRCELRKLKAFVKGEADKRGLRTCDGKMVVEVRPKGNWDKGVAVLWLLRQVFPRNTPADISNNPWTESATSDDNASGEDTDGPESGESGGLSPTPVVPEESSEPFYLYLGDDVSDEAAFKALRKTFPNRCLTVCVSEKPKNTAASHWLKDPSEVFELLQRIHDASVAQDASPPKAPARVDPLKNPVEVSALPTHK